jgi:hypothetical protein
MPRVKRLVKWQAKMQATDLAKRWVWYGWQERPTPQSSP